MRKSRIDIIVPVYNRAKIVQPTLQAIAAQSFKDYRLVLVDNNSTDDTLQVLEAFKQEHSDIDVTIVQCPTSGAAAARNAGFRASGSEWVMFFDSDDLMDSDLVESYMQRIDAVEGAADLVVTRVDVVNLDGSHREYPYYESNLLVHHLFHASLATQRYIVRRRLFERAGEWNEAMLCWDDWELGFRLLLQQPRIVYMGDRVRVHVISTADSITGTEFSSRCGLWERAIDAAEAHLSSRRDCVGQDAKHNGRLLRLLEFRHIALAAEYRRENRNDLAQPLYRDTMSRCRHHVVMSWLYPLCYRYIAGGGRGISHIVKHLVL
ncbi:MAG: glycosyltransferase family 2 protein [Muribaculaceae bacterium]